MPALALKYILVFYSIYLLQEFELLYYNLSSARIFFRMDDDGEDEELGVVPDVGE